MQLRRDAWWDIFGKKDSGNQTHLEEVADDNLIECFHSVCKGTDVTLQGVAACMSCLAPWKGNPMTLQEAIADLVEAGLENLATTNPWNQDIPQASFDAKSKNDSPMGYMHLCKGDLQNCKTQYDDDCYGPNSVCLTSWQDVMDWGPQIPEGQWNGSIWRGQELGTGFLTTFAWTVRGINPYSSLGVTPKQHYAVRPALEKAWGVGAKNSPEYKEKEAMIRKEVQDFLVDRKENGLKVGLPGDLMIFVHGVLFKSAFKLNISKVQSQAFVVLQAMILETALQSMDVNILARVPFAFDLLGKEIERVMESYAPIVKKLYGNMIQGEDCSPSTSCLAQLSSTMLDAMVLAGGISLTLSLNTGVALLFSTAGPSGTPFSGMEEVSNPPLSWKNWGNPFPQRSYKKEEALQYYWEVLRYFAPVGSMASWQVPPTCYGEWPSWSKLHQKPHGKSTPCNLFWKNPATGTHKVNQYTGGEKHVFPSLPVAQRDPKRWGPDGNMFKIRPLDDYKWSVGFGEAAVNPNVASGRMNRVCPGKNLALMVGSIFFEEFNKEDWAEPRIASNITFTQGSKPTSQGGMPFAPAFTLSSKSMVQNCKEVCPSKKDYAAENKACEDAKTACLCKKCTAQGVDKIGNFKCNTCP